MALLLCWDDLQHNYKVVGRFLQIDRVGFRVALRHHQQLARMLLVHYVLLLDVQMRLPGGVFSLSLVDSTDFIR